MLRHLGRKIIIVIFTLSLLCGLPLPARSQPAQARELPADLPPLIEPLFATGGAVTGVAVSGNLAFIVEGGQFLALDVSAPDHILQVGSVYMPGLASGSKVELSGDIAYVLSDKLGLVLIDVSDPSAPRVRGSYLGPGPHTPFSSPSDIALQGSYAYLAIPYHGLQILDVSDPEFPTLVGSINQDHHHPMVEVAGSTIYLLTYSLDIYDATNPAAPLRTSSTFVGDAHDLKINGNYAYVSEVIDGTWGKYGGTPGQETLFVLDISDLQRPTLAGSLEFVILTSTGSMQIQDGQLYLDADGSLMLIDIEVPNNPIILSELPVSFANGVIANGRIYYLEYFVLNIGELQNPDPPVKVGEFGSLNFPDCVRVIGDVAYVRERTFPAALHLFDVSNPAQAQPLITFNDQSLADLCQAKLTGDRAYSTRYMYDLSDPADPKVLYPFSFHSANTNIYANDISIAGTTAYLVNSDGLSIFDISTPNDPQLLSQLAAGFLTQVEAAGGIVYAVGPYDFKVIDVQDPSSPRLLGSADAYATNNRYNLYLTGHVVIIAGSGTTVVDVSNPSQPSLLSKTGIPYADAARYEDGLLYEVSSEEIGVTDLREPGWPVDLPGWNLGTWSAYYFLDVKDDLIYTVADEAGFQIYRLNRAALPPQISLFHSYLPGVAN